MRRAVLSFLWLALGFGLVLEPAWAQVRCLTSFPAPGASYGVPPDRVILWMSEPVDPQLSSFGVASRDGRRFEGPVRVSADGRRVEVALRPLERGVYLVIYRAASAVGGHVSTGFFLFGVGESVPAPHLSWGVRIARWVGAGSAVLAAAWGAPALAVAAVAAAVAEWVQVSGGLLGASLFSLWRAGLIWPLVGGTQAGWGLMLSAPVAAVWLLPRRGLAFLLRAAASVGIGFVAALVALAGGPLEFLGSAHAAVLFLMMAVYAVGGLVALAVVGAAGIRLPEPGWSTPVLGALLLAASALRLADSLWEFLGAWVGLGALAALLRIGSRPEPKDRVGTR
ncbi:MAG: copper resistance protein CopC [Armatimonadota bacterium]|nr:copper resistance protein CopC [Armatimonadota bacterium]MDR7439867.1 copper resistance protein CopC [Armatimonadota bacterium]MDR7563338.1 copper resistance protein CopC [Armatimonadota bacterium]MDR7601959.1 copper resistance protein CopC [Armatimonadota bacterium]